MTLNSVPASGFRTATRAKVFLKLGFTGPSGSGKSYSALLIAKALAQGGVVAAIDTEHGSLSLYAGAPGMPDFQVCDLGPPFTTERYLALINQARALKPAVLLIDSISHQWAGEGGILDRKDREEMANPKINRFSNWAKYTPEHERFKAAINQFPAHVLLTLRSKQEYALSANEKGKSGVQKLGMAPIQREGAEYDYTIVFDLSMEHFATVSKDRTGLFDGQHFRPSEKEGQAILEWLQTGAPMREEPAPAPAPSPRQSQNAEELIARQRQAEAARAAVRAPTGPMPDATKAIINEQLQEQIQRAQAMGRGEKIGEDDRLRLKDVIEGNGWTGAMLTSHLQAIYKKNRATELTRRQFEELLATLRDDSQPTLEEMAEANSMAQAASEGETIAEPSPWENEVAQLSRPGATTTPEWSNPPAPAGRAGGGPC